MKLSSFINDVAVNLIAEAVPPVKAFTVEKLNAREIPHKLNNPVACHIRLFAVRFKPCVDDLMYTVGLPAYFPFGD